MVYDITNSESFNNIVLWLEVVKSMLKDNVDIAVIGNKSKSDLLVIATTPTIQKLVNVSKIINKY